MIYFIADTHFGDEDIILYESRPYQNADSMNQDMIYRWNSVIGADDIVYVLGDFSVAGIEADILSCLNGKKILIKGNHDKASNDYYREAGFSEVYDLPVILEHFWIMSHEPLYINENMPYANIFGHIHSSPMYKTFSTHHCCVSAERIGYTPISFCDVKKFIKKSGE